MGVWIFDNYWVVFCYVLIQDLSSLNSDSFSGHLSHLTSIRLPIVTDLGFRFPLDQLPSFGQAR
jgi:hypothetical protein